MTQVALGIVYCPRRHAVLMLERADLAHGLRWVFPGGKIRDDDATPEEAAKREVEEETGVCTRALKRITAREHPVTRVSIHYCLLEYQRGEASNAEADKHLSVEWWPPEAVVHRFASELAEPVRKHLELLAPRRMDPRCRRASAPRFDFAPS